jgi:HK97 family phage prohead protease
MHKTCPAQIKAAGAADGLQDGQFKAVVSVFGNVDSYGDVVVPGAFTDTLADWKASGESIPIYYSHQINDPTMNIGWVLDAEQTQTGLEILGQLDLADDAPPTAKTVHRLLKRPGGVRDFSFAYDVMDGSPVKDEDGNEHFELRALKLYEVGPTQIGANPATELLAVKRAAESAAQVAADFKAGRVLSSKNETTLTDALASLEVCAASIKNVLASVASTDADESKASTTQEKARETDPAKCEEPPGKGAKPEEPGHETPVTTWAAHLQQLEMEGSS